MKLGEALTGAMVITRKPWEVPEEERTWALAHAMGMTPTEAACWRGMSCSRASEWAQRNGVTFHRPRTLAEIDARIAAADGELRRLADSGAGIGLAMRQTALSESMVTTWAARHGHIWPKGGMRQVDYAEAARRGLTLQGAVRGYGGSLAEAQAWASDRGHVWAAPDPVDAAAPVEDRGFWDDSDNDPWVLQSLWRSVLLRQVQLLRGTWMAAHERRAEDEPQAVLRWFWSADAAIVAMFAGRDIDALRSHVRRLAVSLGLMQPGQVRP